MYLFYINYLVTINRKYYFAVKVHNACIKHWNWTLFNGVISDHIIRRVINNLNDDILRMSELLVVKLGSYDVIDYVRYIYPQDLTGKIS